MEELNEDKLRYLIRDFNGLSVKAGMSSLLNYDKKDGKFTLYLGRKEQFAYGTCECELCNGTVGTLIKCVTAMIRVVCFERHVP